MQYTVAALDAHDLLGRVNVEAFNAADAGRTAMPRAITAAWLVLPPWLVRMPSAATMPFRSSGLVSPNEPE